MSNYNKATNFSVKDTLTSGDPDKVVSGAEIDNEFDAISSAVGSKADKVSSATKDNLAALDSNGNLKDSGGSIISVAPPVGSITMYGGSSAPDGWLYCNGQNVSRTTYSDLFSAIGETFGAGDGSSTFGLPDLRDRFPIGDNSIGASDAARVSNYGTGIGDSGGEDEHQLTEAEMPSHTHSFIYSSKSSNDGPRMGADDNRSDRTQTTDSAGSDQAHNNMPPFLAVSFIIKT